jgi:citrate lyase subunit beta/citryl-CoA lyase
VTERSYLFVPGNRPDRFQAASNAGADVVLIDLEDAVAPGEKSVARQAAADWLGASRPAYLRINGFDTEWFRQDVSLLGLLGLRGVLAAKAEAPTRSTPSIARHHLLFPSFR